MRILTRSLALLALTWLQACATTPAWTETGVDRRHVEGPARSALVLPPFWMYVRTQDGVLATREAPPLQSITLQLRGEIASVPLGGSEPQPPPEELGALLLVEWEREPKTGALVLLDDGPAVVGGVPGFRIHLRHDPGDPAVPVDEYLVYGAGTRAGVFVLCYGAWQGERFQRDLDAFEAVAASLRLPR